MHKRVILALVLVLALLATTGCNLIIKDEEVDRQTPVIEVAGKTFTKGEVLAQTESVLDYYEMMYSYYYGTAYDRTSADSIAQAREEAIDSMVQQAVLEQKLAEGGYNTFTAEEETAIAAQIEEDYQLYYDNVELFYFSDSELTGEEKETAIRAQMDELGYPTREALEESTRMAKAQEKLYNEIIKDVTVTDEEVAAEYQALVDADKANYDANPASYGSALTNGTTTYYTPAGYRNVKHILLQFKAEDQTAIDELNAQLTAKKGEVTAEANETLNKEIADLEAQVAAATETAYTNLQPTIEEIQAKLTAGETFESLIETYDEDPGMTPDTTYAVSADSNNWVEEFKTASMALANVGDVSEPVRSSYGIHIIKYDSDIAAGEVGLDTVKEDIQASLLSAKQSEVYSAAFQQWVTDAAAKIDTKVLDN